uniref:Cyclic nucleotide-binding domain-containing protein n=1 Tax=Macrostomum lignano TaxID=282301 RepID=A0A1I8INU3_9PLAT
ECLDFFGLKRTDYQQGIKFQGVETPSQNRYVGYFETVKKEFNYEMPPDTPLIVRKIIIHGISSIGNGDGSDFWFRIFEGGKQVGEFDLGINKNCMAEFSRETDSAVVTLRNPPTVLNDVKFSFFSRNRNVPTAYENCAFFFWIYTYFIQDLKIKLDRTQLDNPHKSKTWKAIDTAPSSTYLVAAAANESVVVRLVVPGRAVVDHLQILPHPILEAELARQAPRQPRHQRIVDVGQAPESRQPEVLFDVAAAAAAAWIRDTSCRQSMGSLACQPDQTRRWQRADQAAPQKVAAGRRRRRQGARAAVDEDLRGKIKGEGGGVVIKTEPAGWTEFPSALAVKQCHSLLLIKTRLVQVRIQRLASFSGRHGNGVGGRSGVDRRLPLAQPAVASAKMQPVPEHAEVLQQVVSSAPSQPLPGKPHRLQAQLLGQGGVSGQLFGRYCRPQASGKSPRPPMELVQRQQGAETFNAQGCRRGAHQVERIVECISKPPVQRHDSELNELVGWFLTKCPLKIKPDVAKDILRNCEFRESPRDDVIIRQGDQGDCFYICLTGKVSVYINTEAVPDDPTEAQVLVDDSSDAASGEKKELDRTKYGKYIVSFGAGRGFGELALINKDCVRNASIIADETTRLIVVNRALYNRSLKAVQEAEFKERIDFVNKCPVFDNWLARYKRQAAMSLRKEMFNFEMTIAKQGDALNGLYFILSGQAKLVVDIIQHYSQYPQLHLHDSPEDLQQREIMGKLMEQNPADERSQSRRHQQLWDKPIRRRGYAAAEHRQSQRHVEISLIGPGEMIGDIEHGMDLSTYAQSVICVQPTEVFVLDSKNFERLVLNKRNQAQTLEILARKAETKLMSRVTRALDKQVPLIRNLCHRILESHRAEERRRQKADKERDFDVRDSDMSHFIPSRGPLIDPYGPGTVFYRNKMKRERKLAAQKAKEAKMGGRKPPAAAAAMFAVDEPGTDDEGADGAAAATDHRRLDDPYEAARRVLDEFEDFDTSSEHLVDLERRISVWFDNVDQTKRGARVVQMTRFHKEEDRKIHPGKKVYMRPKKQPRRVTLGSSEPEDWGYKSEEEIFITAQAEMRSRLSSRGTTIAQAQQANLPDDEEEPGSSSRAVIEAQDEEAFLRHLLDIVARRDRLSEPAIRRQRPATTGRQSLQAPTGLPPVVVELNSRFLRPRTASMPPLLALAGGAAGWGAAAHGGGGGGLRQQNYGYYRPPQPTPPAVAAKTAIRPSSAPIISGEPHSDKRNTLLARAQSFSSINWLYSPNFVLIADFIHCFLIAQREHERTYTLEEYKELRALLRKREMQLILPEEVKETLRDLERMNTVLPDLDCNSGRQQSLERRRSRTFRARTILLPSRMARDSTVCLRCRRHHLASTTH